MRIILTFINIWNNYQILHRYFVPNHQAELPPNQSLFFRSESFSFLALCRARQNSHIIDIGNTVKNLENFRKNYQKSATQSRQFIEVIVLFFSVKNPHIKMVPDLKSMGKNNRFMTLKVSHFWTLLAKSNKEYYYKRDCNSVPANSRVLIESWREHRGCV